MSADKYRYISVYCTECNRKQYTLEDKYHLFTFEDVAPERDAQCECGDNIGDSFEVELI